MLTIKRKKKGPYLPKQTVNGVRISGQEYQVLQLIGKGLCSSEIARLLETDVNNIDNVKQSLRKKLGARHHAHLMNIATREQIRREIKDGDFVRDDLLAEWISHRLENVQTRYLLDIILEFRLLTSLEAWEQLKQAYPNLPIRRPE